MSGHHTPGPWQYRPLEHDDWGIVRCSEGPIVAYGRSGVFMTDALENAHREAGTDPYEANARLIAAAPDLLAAIAGDDPDMPTAIQPIEWLHSLLNLCEEPHVRTALDRDNDDPDATDMMLRELRDLVTIARAAIAKATMPDSKAQPAAAAPRPD